MSKISKSKLAPGPNLDPTKFIKRRITGVPHVAVLRVAKGFGDIAMSEVTARLAPPLLQPKFEPNISLTENGIQIANIGWRDLLALTAHLTMVREVLWEIGGGRAGSIKEIKDRIEELPWNIFLPQNCSISVRANSIASHIYHEGKIAELITKTLKKFAINVTDREKTPHLMDIRLVDDRLKIYLSLNGRPLYQRGYKRVLSGIASVKEDIASAAISAALNFAHEHKTEKFEQILVPFAGSGTFAFEAAMTLGRLPPWLFFGELSAESYPCCATASLGFARQQSARLIDTSQIPNLTLMDIDGKTCESLTININGFNDILSSHSIPPIRTKVIQGDVLKFDLEETTRTAESTLILMNPPFGARLGSKSSTGLLYQQIGQKLSKLHGVIAGFVFAPTLAVADRLISRMSKFQINTKPFNHGGRTVYLVLFSSK